MKALKYIVIFGFICLFVCSFLIFAIFKMAYKEHYHSIQISSYGIVSIENKKYIYINTDISSLAKSCGKVLAIGMKSDKDNELNISYLGSLGTQLPNGYRFIPSPVILIPSDYFIEKETVITTSSEHYPVLIVKKKNDNIEISTVKVDK